MSNVIDCPKCKAVLAERNVTLVGTERGYPYFGVICKPCGHQWEAHHQEWRKGPQGRNPFTPVNITPRF